MESLLIELNNGNLNSCLSSNKSNENKFILSPINSHSYKIAEINEFSQGEEDAQYIEVDLVNNKVNIKSSWYGEFPLFFYFSAKEKTLLVDSNFESIIKRLQFIKKKVEIDSVGFYQAAILDNPLRRRTLFKDIFKCIAGEEISIDLNNGEIKRENVWILPFNKGGYEKSKEEYLATAKSILNNLLQPYTEILSDEKELLAPLSGGLDSRLLVSLAKKEKLNFNSLVFGTRHSNEVVVANEVAKRLNIKLEYKELMNFYYLNYGEEVVRYTGGLSSPMHCHLYSILKANKLSPKYILHGFMGDVYAGDSQPSFANDFTISKDQALQMYINKVKKHHLWIMLNEEEKKNL